MSKVVSCSRIGFSPGLIDTVEMPLKLISMPSYRPHYGYRKVHYFCPLDASVVISSAYNTAGAGDDCLAQRRDVGGYVMWKPAVSNGRKEAKENLYWYSNMVLGLCRESLML